ncbi:Uncharacterised protein [Burkholderia pseudomallei]|nr:Uncharacterised protein [Burkholderia pseudomallei]CFL74541.1 Uncharacterised protein [Burkholderia pseudomallei]CPI57449.1 Uncharacterised protein [Burkholderia pseudomallei]
MDTPINFFSMNPHGQGCTDAKTHPHPIPAKDDHNDVIANHYPLTTTALNRLLKNLPIP